ncbi:MAG: cbb3-type cytochrome oxidase assembly protein CcoS [Chryseolinea sp.]
MNIIIALICISLFIAVGFLISFLWSLNDGQFDDTYSPSVRMLRDGTVKKKKTKKNERAE